MCGISATCVAYVRDMVVPYSGDVLNMCDISKICLGRTRSGYVPNMHGIFAGYVCGMFTRDLGYV